MTLSPELGNAAFARAKDIISSGGVIAYPTDTFYGLGVDPANANAVRRLFAIKGRDENRPILLLLADRDSVGLWAEFIPDAAQRLMQLHWPGPLTLVFRARFDVLPELTAGTGTIGLRVPGNEMTRSLLRFIGSALTGTSANRSGEMPPRSATEVLSAMGADVDLILDGGQSVAEMPSTVVDVTAEKPVLIRRGAVSAEKLF